MQQLRILMMRGADLGTWVILLAMCPQDLAEHEIHGKMLAGLAGTAALSGICRMMDGGPQTSGVLSLLPSGLLLCLALFPGLLMTAVSKISGEKMGLGDALTMMALGFRMDPVSVWLISQTALIAAALWGSVRRSRTGCREEIAMIPFAAAAAGILLWSA